MKLWLIIGAAAAQILVLAWMGGEREWVMTTGKRIHLRTAPVDPRDAMRGDYVRMDYEISHVPRALVRDGLTNALNSKQSLPKDMRVYGALRTDENGVAELASLSDRPPKDGMFIRARIQDDPNADVSVRFGLEAFFMEQGKALEVEESRFRGGVQVPLEMEVALSRGGLAVLKSMRWSQVALGVVPELSDASQTNSRGARRVIAAKVFLFNATTNQDVAVVDLPEGRSFLLRPDTRTGNNSWQWVDKRAPLSPQPQNVVLLKPGQTHTNRIDFSKPEWFVFNDKSDRKELVALGDAGSEWWVRFRFVYQPPDKAACAGMPYADLIWHGRLQSRVFNSTGSVD